MRASLALALALALAAGCGEPASPLAHETSAGTRAQAPRPVARRADLGRATPELGETCRACHTDLVDAYRRTGMARALGALVPGELDGLAAVEDGASGFTYAFEPGDVGAGAAPRIVETRTGPDPSGHRLAAELVFAIGAGELDRSFAARLGERTWMAPLEVVQGTQRPFAALAPGHAIAPGLRFDLALTPECFGCHTDAPPPRDEPLDLAAPASWTPSGISCAACHGAADLHAAWRVAERDGRAPDGADPVLRPAELARHERLSICAACHLQGDARLLLDADTLGPPPPGGDLLAQRAVFVARQATNEIGFVSQVERLVLSRCFLESPELDCATCHDPHVPLADERERAIVRAACLACHPSADDAAERTARACALSPARRDGDCASCHMPARRTFDVADVVIHDHWIRARPGPPSAPAPLRMAESPSADWRVFAWPEREPPAFADDPGLWAMALAHRGHDERALARFDEPAGPTSAALPMHHHVRGSLFERVGRTDEALAAYARALELDPDLAPSAINRGLLLAREGEPQQGLALLSSVIARHPRSVGALRNRALVRASLGDADGFARDLERAYTLDPRPELADALAAHCNERGDLDAARAWDAAARALDPAR